jgi:hypothetical protein
MAAKLKAARNGVGDRGGGGGESGIGGGSETAASTQ